MKDCRCLICKFPLFVMAINFLAKKSHKIGNFQIWHLYCLWHHVCFLYYPNEKLSGCQNCCLSTLTCSTCIPWSYPQLRMSGSLASYVCWRYWSWRLQRMQKNILPLQWTCISNLPLKAVSLASTYWWTLFSPTTLTSMHLLMSCS